MGTTAAQTIKELFGVGPSDAIQPRPRREGLPYPEAKEFVFEEARTLKMLRFFAGKASRNNLLLIGPAGAGKTAVVEQMAARLNWPVWAVSCSGKVRASHWYGYFALQDGKTVWQDGPLTLAMRHGGIFLADEITRLEPAEQMALVRVLDGGDVAIPETGEVIKPHKLFRFVATGNSGGFGDPTGSYAGERIASFAFVDRFLKFEVKYLDRETEAALIKKLVPELPEGIILAIVSLAERVRGASAANGAGGLRVNMSTRACIAIAKEAYAYTTMGIKHPLSDALQDVVFAGAPQEDVDACMTFLNEFIST